MSRRSVRTILVISVGLVCLSSTIGHAGQSKKRVEEFPYQGPASTILFPGIPVSLPDCDPGVVEPGCFEIELGPTDRTIHLEATDLTGAEVFLVFHDPRKDHSQHGVGELGPVPVEHPGVYQVAVLNTVDPVGYWGVHLATSGVIKVTITNRRCVIGHDGNCHR